MGINSAIFTPSGGSDGVGFAIPIQEALAMAAAGTERRGSKRVSRKRRRRLDDLNPGVENARRRKMPGVEDARSK